MCLWDLLAKISEIAIDIIANITDIITNLTAAVSVPGVCVALYNAKGRVCVSPGILDTKVIVAPNSAKHLAKAKVAPVIIAGSNSGKVIVTKHLIFVAPWISAASSNFGSRLSNPRRIDLTRSGKLTIADAMAAPFQEKFTDILKYS